MKRFVAVLVLAACGTKARDSGGSEAPPEPAAPAAGSQGYLLWTQTPPPPAKGDFVAVRPNDHLMLMDVAKRQSVDLGASPLFRLTAVSPSSDGVALALGSHVAHVHLHGGTATVEAPPGLDPRTDSSIDNIIAIAPDSSSAVRWTLDGLCVSKPEDAACTSTIKMPTLENGGGLSATYVSPTRVIVSASVGTLKSNEAAFAMSVVAVSVDLVAKTAMPLEIPAAMGEQLAVAPDGRIAWTEVADSNIVLATATVDAPTTKATYIMGPAEAQAFSECTWGGPMLVCVVRTRNSLVSIDTRTRTQLTLRNEGAFSKNFVVSKDGKWVVYYTTHESLLGSQWHISPTDKADASEDLPLPHAERPLAWL
ncbi:MAG TPA: hypothetical protein VGM90_13425 [Kofleriaceae bacterium]